MIEENTVFRVNAYGAIYIIKVKKISDIGIWGNFYIENWENQGILFGLILFDSIEQLTRVKEKTLFHQG